MSSEADALLDAIWANPGDDTPRLVYADWLQENDYEEYAQFLRLSLLIARQVLTPDERARLRRLRYCLGRDIIKAYPQSARLITERNPPDGIPQETLGVDAAEFLTNWPVWWPFLRPRRLTLWNLSGREAGLGGCEYLNRVLALQCKGNVIAGWGNWREEAAWQSLSGVLLAELGSSRHTQNLGALKGEPIRATADELLAFAETPLALRLDELHLWVEFPDGSREDLRAHTGQIQHAIHAFVTEHADRLPAS